MSSKIKIEVKHPYVYITHEDWAGQQIQIKAEEEGLVIDMVGREEMESVFSETWVDLFWPEEEEET